VDGGDSFAVAVDGDGRVVGWGRAFYGELGDGDGDHASRLRELALPVDCARVACGQNHVLAVSRDGAGGFFALMCGRLSV
jgi:alpha-tubulin suppressor-like RCC1 family protein